MSETIVGLWVIVIGVVGLNGFAAGVVALLHARRRTMRRSSRVLSAVMTAGLLPAQFLIVVPLTQDGAGQTPFIWLLAFGMTLAVVALLSMPGAIAAVRKLDAPSDDFRAFE